MRRLFKFGIILILTLLFLILFVPLLFKSKITSELQNTLNKSINGKIQFDDLSISLIRNFPKLTITLENFRCSSFVNQDTTELANIDKAHMGLNLWKLLTDRSNVSIDLIELRKPKIRIISFDSLNANYNLTLAEATSDTGKKDVWNLNIESIRIDEGQLDYIDLQNATKIEIKNLSHKGTYQNSDNLFTCNATTTIAEFSFKKNSISLLKSLKLDGFLNLEYQKPNRVLKINKTTFVLNELKLECEGNIGFAEDSTKIDLKLHTPANNFKELFSIIPNAYTKNFHEANSGGTFTLNGSVTGIYHKEKRIYPSWDVQCVVENGSLNYPDKSILIENFQMELISKNTGPGIKDSELGIKTLSVLINQQPFKGSLYLKNLTGDTDFSGSIQGIINLHDLNGFYSMNSGNKLSGVLKPDVQYQFQKSQVESRDYDAIKLIGKLSAENIKVVTGEYPDIELTTASLDFDPKKIFINSFLVNFGKSDLSAKGWIQDPLDFFTSGPLVGKLTVNSKLIDLIEWNKANSGKRKNPEHSVKGPVTIPGIVKKLQLDIDANIQNLYYSEYDIQSFSAKGKINSDKVTVQKCSLIINKNGISGSGSLEGVYGFIMHDDILNGTLSLHAPQFDADKYLSGSIKSELLTNQQAAKPTAFQVPEKFNLDVKYKIDEFLFKPLKLNQVNGNLTVANQEIQFQNLHSKIYGGTFQAKGIYNTSEPEKPIFNFKMDMLKLPFTGALNSFATLKSIAPVMQYIQGYFNSNLIVQGSLTKEMMPEISSLNVDGLFETLDGSIKGFKPLEVLADKLKISSLKNLNIKNTKNWVTVKNGIVNVKDFNRKIDDYDININGSHNIAGGMNYQILVKIPKQKIQQFISTIKIDKAADQLSSLLDKYGLGSSLISELNVLTIMTGTFNDPNFSFKLIDAKGDATSSGSIIQEGAKVKIKDTIAAAIEEGKKITKEQIAKVEDTLNKEITKKAEELKNKILTDATKELDSSLSSKAKESLDSLSQKILNKEAKKEVDQIKDKMKDWNPFKKEKK